MSRDYLGERTRVAYNFHETVIALDQSEVKEGVTVFEKCVAYRSGADVRFYNRICDHNGGNLVSSTEDPDMMRCPLHGWVFDPTGGQYTNVNMTKTPLAFDKMDGQYLVRLAARTMDWPTAPAEGNINLTFLNHACFVIDIAGKLRFATDPWVLGSAFCDGWWLSEASPEDAIERLESCDFIYISHNHPDHLHAETLQELSRDTRFLVPKFSNQSVGRYLRHLGFENILSCDFGDVFDFGIPGFKLTILKSGDFRDDSGIVFSYGDFVSVMAVDCNALNTYALPKNTTLLATSFAGGATGFPLCFLNYDEQEKARIVARNRNALVHAIDKYIAATEPAFYVPYAGFFKEDPVRDGYVASRNKKNSITDIKRHVCANGTGFINPVETRSFTFHGNDLVGNEEIPLAPTDTDKERHYEESDEKFGDVSDAEIEAYFRGATFRESLILYINLCDSGFHGLGRTYAIDFREDTVGITQIERRPTPAEITLNDGINRVIIDLRAAAFGRIIREFLPWEDFMIGFQARLERWPNVYNSRMWYYFTNEYIVDFARKASFDCGQACVRLEQETL